MKDDKNKDNKDDNQKSQEMPSEDLSRPTGDAEASVNPEGVRSAAARGVAPSARGDGPDGRAPKDDASSAITDGI